MIKTATFRSCT